MIIFLFIVPILVGLSALANAHERGDEPDVVIMGVLGLIGAAAGLIMAMNTFSEHGAGLFVSFFLALVFAGAGMFAGVSGL